MGSHRRWQRGEERVSVLPASTMGNKSGTGAQGCCKRPSKRPAAGSDNSTEKGKWAAVRAPGRRRAGPQSSSPQWEGDHLLHLTAEPLVAQLQYGDEPAPVPLPAARTLVNSRCSVMHTWRDCAWRPARRKGQSSAGKSPEPRQGMSHQTGTMAHTSPSHRVWPPAHRDH
jgi:hypothetical protein